MERKLTPKVHAVFVHVSDLKQSAEWYSHLLGVPFDSKTVEPPVYNVPVSGDTYLTLDEHTYDPNYEQAAFKNPAFNVCSEDLKMSLNWVRNEGISVVREIEAHGDFGWFHIKDPDGNVIMVCGTIKMAEATT